LLIESNWCHSPPTDINKKFLDWLTKPYIISKAMKQVCTNLAVKIISQELDIILPSETNLLNYDNDKAFIRKVFLTGDNFPWEYARVVVPKTTYLQYKTTFTELGGKLIGENLLYNNPKTTRDKFEYTSLNNNSFILNEINRYLANLNFDINVSEIYGRRSIFHIDGAFPLLISEFFLPQIPEYPKD